MNAATRATIKANLTSEPQLSLGRRGRQDFAGSVAGWPLGESKQSREGRVTALSAGIFVQFRLAHCELGCLWSESNKAHFINILIDVKQTLQRRPESLTVIASHRGCASIQSTWTEGRAFCGVYVPCVYSHARWELPLATDVFAVVFIWLPSSSD